MGWCLIKCDTDEQREELPRNSAANTLYLCAPSPRDNAHRLVRVVFFYCLLGLPAYISTGACAHVRVRARGQGMC